MSTHAGSIGSLGVVLQHSRQAKVGHLALQVVVDQDVARGQIAVNVAHVGEVLHARGDATQHAHKLEGCHLTVVVLRDNKNKQMFKFYSNPVST